MSDSKDILNDYDKRKKSIDKSLESLAKNLKDDPVTTIDNLHKNHAEKMNEMTKEVFKDSIEELAKTGNIKMPILNKSQQAGKAYENVIINPNKRLEKRSGSKTIIDEMNEWSNEVDKQIQKSVTIPEVKPCEECGRDPIPAGLSSSVNDCKSCGKPKQYGGIIGGLTAEDLEEAANRIANDGWTKEWVYTNTSGSIPWAIKTEWDTETAIQKPTCVTKPKVCECGAESTYGKNAGGHSRYCDFFQGDKY